MDNKVNYTYVGLFVVVLVAALVTIFIWLEGLTKRENLVDYAVYMNESVAGLVPKAQVTFNGVKVGTVDSIELNPRDPQQVRLILSVKANTPINQSTVAVLKSQGITGVTYVGLSATRKDAPPIIKRSGHTYPMIPSKPSFLETISDALEDVTKNIKTLSVSVQKLVDDQNRQAIADSLQSIKSVTNNLVKNEKHFNKIILSTESLTKNLATSSQHLPDTVRELNEALKSLTTMADKITTAGTTINTTMEGANSLIENVSQQMVPQTTDMMQEINETIRQINQLSAKLQRNPSMLIRGQNPAPLGPGEK